MPSHIEGLYFKDKTEEKPSKAQSSFWSEHLGKCQPSAVYRHLLTNKEKVRQRFYSGLDRFIEILPASV